MTDTLPQTSLFPKLSDEQLQRLTECGNEMQLKPGEMLFAEGDPTYDFYVVLEGEIKITKKVGEEEIVLVVHEPGEFTGELSMLTGEPSLASAHAVGASRVLRFEAHDFKHFVTTCTPMRDILIPAMAQRSKDLEAQMRQQEKLAALGKLSAGLAHELNNPAAAGGRAAKQLREALQSLQSRTLSLHDQHFSASQRQLLVELQQEAMTHSTKAPLLDPLTQSDREDALTEWLEQHEIADGWQMAPTLVSAGIDEERLNTLAAEINSEALGEALIWLEASLTMNGLVNEVEQSTARISQLVKAVKAYSYMDQAPLQAIDLHEGLENTLIMLGHKLKRGVTVTRAYDQSLPRICAHGSELNQVWTNLIDNAIDAMNGQGHLEIRTSREYEDVLVEIVDNGPGIPPAIQCRLWEPFFTTKGVGEGTGLGLDIARRIVVKRHKGNIRFFSEQGNTRFEVRLPINGQDSQSPLPTPHDRH